VNALGIAYLVLAGTALVLATVHVAQALVIRSDKSQYVTAAVCLGFALFDLGIAFSSEHTGAVQPTWAGWHLLAAASAAALTSVVPALAWLVLEVRSGERVTWERLHALDHA
jgi:hypothetical protein